jgi:DNA mismatch repair protein MutL
MERILMPRIRQLPPGVITKIAAGEVIERPASVVKELLENSVDAGSTRIDVEVEQGGIELIRVADDGHGIDEADLLLAFASHATSKLTTAEELFEIATMGFRGEALASIGGVAQVTLQSRPPDQDAGSEVACHGGDLSAIKPWNGSPGTRIEVRHLFYNTPVRRKFLRSIPTEMGHITEIFLRIALAQPTLHLTLRHNGKLLHDIPASAHRLDRIGFFFGNDVRRQCHEILPDTGPMRLSGFIADPACERGNAKLQYFFVNGRWIRDRSLSHALQEGYRGLLMTGRYAVGFLFLDMPADAVDVNVHPTKAEVRFRDAQAAHHLVFTNVRKLLQSEDLTAKLRVSSTLNGGRAQHQFGAFTAEPFALSAPPRPAPDLPFDARMPWEKEPANGVNGKSGAHTSDKANGTQPEPRPVGDAGDEEHEQSDVAVTNDMPIPVLPPERMPALSRVPQHVKAIQLYDAYLVLETAEGMLVIDQHALHERILFEQWKQRIKSGTLDTQRLLVPEPVDLGAEQAARLLEQRAALAELGLEVEDFGGGTVLLAGYPAMLDKCAPADILQAVVDHLATKDRLPSREVLLNDLLSLLACHAAVKAGDRLTPEAIQELIALKQLADNTHHCPHGRPTSLLFSKHDLDRQFRRV